MRIIYTKIVADLFHPGHVNFLREARSRGDKLVVHVVDDERVSAYKGRPVMTQKERIAVVGACKYVDQVVENGPKVISRSFLEENGYSAYAFGFANETEKAAKLADCSDLPPEMIEIIDYTPEISSTLIKKRLKNESSVFQKQSFRNVFFYFIVLFLLLIGSAILDRLLGFTVSLFDDENPLETSGIHFKPNSKTQLETDEFSYTVVANKFGLRSPDIELNKPDSIYRILTIGDSWTMGYGVENHQAWPQVLQEILQSGTETNIEVVNAGRSGAGPGAYAETLNKTIQLFNPDLVLLGLLQVNDLTDILLNENQEVRDQNRSKRKFMARIKGIVTRLWPNVSAFVSQLNSVGESRDLRSLWRASVGNMLKSFDPIDKIRYEFLDEEVRQRFESGNLNPQLLRLYTYFPERPFAFNESDNSKSKQMLDELTNRVLGMKQVSESSGTTFAIVHLPMNYFTGHEVVRNTFDQVTPHLLHQNQIDSLMKSRLDQLDIKSLFLTEAFVESDQTEPLFFKFDGHPTPAGHKLIAESIASWDFLQLELSTQH